MFNWIVRNSLHNRLFVLAFAAILMVYGIITAVKTLLEAPHVLGHDHWRGLAWPSQRSPSRAPPIRPTMVVTAFCGGSRAESTTTA